jgi:hypothetical protein
MPPSRLAVLTALPNRPNYSHSFGKASLSDSYFKEERDPGARQRKEVFKDGEERVSPAKCTYMPCR